MTFERITVHPTDAGWDVVHVAELGLRDAHDEVVPQAAKEDQRTLVSADSDFGALPRASAPSVVLITPHRYCLQRSGSGGPVPALRRRAPAHRSTRPTGPRARPSVTGVGRLPSAGSWSRPRHPVDCRSRIPAR
ncbi:MAG: DUF5615 family PIN-like protein [Pseudonocardia sp.]